MNNDIKYEFMYMKNIVMSYMKIDDEIRAKIPEEVLVPWLACALPA